MTESAARSRSTPRLTPIPVALVTGFLGAGKTTLINAILRDPRYADTAVVVNEFGAIGLDALLIEKSADNVLLLDSGCLCCAMRDGLRETLADLVVRRAKGTIAPFARVIVETSGLADPAPIANDLVSDTLMRAEFRLAGIVTVVDALNAPAVLGEWEAARQIALADTIVFAKTDLAEPQAIESIERAVAELNPSAERVRAVRGDLAPENLFRGQGARLASALWTAGPIGARDRHLRGIHSVTFTTETPLEWPAVAAWLAILRERFGARLLRAKALVAMADGASVVLHAMSGCFHPPERLARWPDPQSRASRFVLIARDIEPAALQASFVCLGETTSQEN